MGEFELADKLDFLFPVVAGKVVDSTKSNLVPKSQTRKYTVSSLLTTIEAQSYLYELARSEIISQNSRLRDYRIEVKTDSVILPTNRIFLYYNSKISNFSGDSEQKIEETKVVAGIQYNLTENKVAVVLSSSGRYSYTANHTNNIRLTNQLRRLTQTT